MAHVAVHCAYTVFYPWLPQSRDWGWCRKNAAVDSTNRFENSAPMRTGTLHSIGVWLGGAPWLGSALWLGGALLAAACSGSEGTPMPGAGTPTGTSVGPGPASPATPSTDSTTPPPPPPHWSFIAPQALVPPPVEDAAWVKNEIDSFVLARLTAEGVAHSEPASPEKLLRRVTLTLTGLPPTLEQIDAFMADPSEEAYLAAVDRLLSSPRYAEHMTASWLDIARYSDTDGFQYDINRPAWPWRDWVIRAFDTNMPWDEFTTQQLAGDLIAAPTDSSILATAFNRNHAIQGENGLLKDSFRDRYVSDRVETLGKGWLGLTLGCAKCHDHKYDPILAEDFYRLYDCFNQIDEKDNGPTSEFSPAMDLTSPLTAGVVADLDTRIKNLEAEGAAQNVIDELVWERGVANKELSMRIMADMNPGRPTHKLALGAYDAPYGDPVKCSAPASLPPFPEGAPQNRLGLAQWLTMPSNPLTARVTVNRFWLHHFGRGLVPEIDNFGVLTPAPEYLDLLDWLAVHFIESGWDVKALHRLIVTSNTFRQSSHTDEATLAQDPRNALYGRGPRFRLPAEVLRDMPLMVSGLLVERIGGVPAYPYQPPGLWEELSWESNVLSYPQMAGDTLYRRSLYSFWKKTLPPPFMSLFDAPDREYSVAYRENAITPSQSLALLNDRQFVEAARALATRVLTASGGSIPEAMSMAFRMLTARQPNEAELGIMADLFDTQVQAFVEVSAPETPQADVDHAALSQVMRVLFNLSETVTQE